MLDAEEHMRRWLDGKFFHYIGKPTAPTSVQIKLELQRIEKQKALAEQRAREKRDRELIEKQIASEPEYKRIIAVVAHVHRITVEELLSRSRNSKIAAARHHLIWELRNRKCQFSLTKIGQIINRDHSTVNHSLEFMAKSGHLLKDKLDAAGRLLTK